MLAVKYLREALVPLAVLLLTIGMILLLVVLSQLIPWGMGRGCWAQC
ncbi:MAG TPA: hypothetical protein VFJ63_05040 [Candidatus Bathyarchaeia archaeon]|nr:hypothetical protein [Candidatus Bathyarchaeia archaeon]